MRVRLIPDQLEVFVGKIEDRADIGIDFKPRQRARRAGQLQVGLLQVVEVEVRIAEGVYEVAGFQACHLRHHQGQCSVACDVEGHAEEHVGRALIELAG